jgi:hypothetical protein
VGTSSLLRKDHLHLSLLGTLAETCADLAAAGCKVIVVTSGAVGAGCQVLGTTVRGTPKPRDDFSLRDPNLGRDPKESSHFFSGHADLTPNQPQTLSLPSFFAFSARTFRDMPMWLFIASAQPQSDAPRPVAPFRIASFSLTLPVTAFPFSLTSKSRRFCNFLPKK